MGWIFRSSRSNCLGDQSVGEDAGWGIAVDPDRLWSFEKPPAVKTEAALHSFKLKPLKNFDPAHWHDVLLDGPKKAQQLENLKTIVCTIGRVGIPIIGYNFSLAGVAGPAKDP